MREIIRNNIIDLPFSLHDCHIHKILIDANNVKLIFKDGYYDLFNGDCMPTKGYIEFQNVDFDYCSVYMFHTSFSRLKGKRFRLEEFSYKYKELDLEIIDETYGYNISKFSGVYYKGKKTVEFMIEIYHLGDMKYIT